MRRRRSVRRPAGAASAPSPSAGARNRRSSGEQVRVPVGSAGTPGREDVRTEGDQRRDSYEAVLAPAPASGASAARAAVNAPETRSGQCELNDFCRPGNPVSDQNEAEVA